MPLGFLSSIIPLRVGQLPRQIGGDTTGSVVVNFLVNGDPIEVKTRSSADLPLSLTGQAAMWIDSAQINVSAYHLRYLHNDQSFPPIEYINND